MGQECVDIIDQIVECSKTHSCTEDVVSVDYGTSTEVLLDKAKDAYSNKMKAYKNAFKEEMRQVYDMQQLHYHSMNMNYNIHNVEFAAVFAKLLENYSEKGAELDEPLILKMRWFCMRQSLYDTVTNYSLPIKVLDILRKIFPTKSI